MAGCVFCGGTLDTHSSTEVTCTNCGLVNDGTQMVNELTFGESSSGAAVVHGSFLNADQGTNSRGLYGHSGNSRSLTVEKARSQMMGVAHNLRIPESSVMQAVAYFKLALHNGFVKGRKSRYVTSACLYLACRQHKTAHMLMNFASLLYVNVFVLGSTYLQLVHALEVQSIPPIDPTLFIQRFVSKLDFPSENDGRKVMRDAIRLVQRMNKDWITEGRRPAGVAAACVLLACRMNNFRRSKLQIMQMAMISEGTINERLKEFKSTNAATLTIRDFQATNVDSSADPPSFTRNREEERAEELSKSLRDNIDPLDNPDIRDIYDYVMEATENEVREENDEDLVKDIQKAKSEISEEVGISSEIMDDEKKPVESGTENDKDDEEDPANEGTEKSGKTEPESETETITAAETEKDPNSTTTTTEAQGSQTVVSFQDNAENIKSTAQAVRNLLNDTVEERQARIQAILKRHNHPVVRITSKEEGWDPKASGISDDPENLSDVDDDEINSIILPTHQVKDREQLWLTLHKDYELEQAHKRNKKQADIQAGTYKEPRKRKRPNTNKAPKEAVVPKTANAAATGMVKKKLFSRKINYNAVSNLF